MRFIFSCPGRPFWFYFAPFLVLFVLAADGFGAGAEEGPGESDSPDYEQAEFVAPTFPIRAFEVAGNTLYPTEIIDEVLKEMLGEGKNADDVEAARALLERFYQETGFIRVMVDIPEQMVEDGTILLHVTESRIGEVQVTGNRYFTREAILDALPSLAPGKVLYVPDVEDELGELNKTPDLRVRLGLLPSREPGVDNVELKVEDVFPVHSRLELSNRSTHDTSALRLNGTFRYDNLWHKGHSVAAQYQTAPKEPDEVQVFGGSYVLPVPWGEKHLLATYALWTDSDTAYGDGFNVTGKGFIVGMRYLVPLPSREQYYHSISIGADYKDFDETLGFAGEEEGRSEAPISYLPFAAEYNGTFLGDGGITRLRSSINWAFRDLVGEQEEFANKRLYARGDYLYFKLGLDRTQKLPWGMALAIDTEGQVASEPLVSSEQFSAGGMESVRGYKESDSLGDDGVRASVEWRLPDLGKSSAAKKWLNLTPYLFYDVAWLDVQQPQPGQTDEFKLNGAGVGVRGALWTSLEYQVDMARALTATDRAGSGDTRCHFLVKYLF